MCLICVQFNDEKLTGEEAWRNLDEMSEGLGPEHTREVSAMIIQREMDRLAESFLEPYDYDEYQTLDFEFDFDLNEFTD